MEATQDFQRKIHTLGILRPMCLNWAWGVLWSKKKEQEDALRNLGENLKGVLLVGDSLGLTVKPDKVFTARPSLVGGLTVVLMNNCVKNHDLGLLVRETFGPSEALRFLFTELACITTLSAGFMKVALNPDAPRKQSDHWREECKEATQLYTGLSNVILARRTDLTRIFGQATVREFVALVPALRSRRLTRSRCALIERRSQKLLHVLAPDAVGIEERRARSRELWDQLQACKPGRAHWREYEDLCARILRYLLVPPFRTLTIQARTEDGFERRDVILSNNQDSGFWGQVRHELGSRHLLCEFKNLRTGGSKADLNQLRIYLSKRTVGRFGLLFMRGSASPSLRKAQRDAYEQSGILVLVLDDKLVEDLIFARVFLGRVDDVLERQKIAFEVGF